MSNLVLSLVVLIAVVDAVPQFRHHHEDYRLCVPDAVFGLCEQMTAGRHGDHKIECVSAPDKIGCIDRIIRGEAGWTILDPEELYIAYRFLPVNGVVVTSEIRSAQYADRDYRYAAVVVVRKSSGISGISDLKGKRSCHTGFGRTAGWKVPFSHLFTRGQLKCTNETLNAVERDLATVQGYFGPTCAPGPWLLDPEQDKILKKKYSQLCQLCKNPETCGKEDSHAGYDGALRCLTENNGDIAWTKLDAVREYFKLNESSPLDISSEYELLCRDGSRVELTSDKPCTWAKRPWRTIVMTNHFSQNQKLIEELQEQITQLRKEAQASDSPPQWFTKVLDFYEPTDVEYHYPAHRVKTILPQAYLRPTNYSETLWHPSCGIIEKSLRICVFNQVELQKCNALKLAAISQRISPGFSCILGTCVGHCSYLVSKGDADLVVSPPQFADKIQNSSRLPNKLIPILREVESIGQGRVPFRYALALVSNDIADQFQGNLDPLRGKRSCHGSIKSLAGWNAPLAVLRDAGQISGENCALPLELAKYFNQSCVPGIRDAKQYITGEESLCSICAGDGIAPGKAQTPETVCSDTPNELYQGSSGALRCLQDRVADVAFVDHLALLQRLRTPTKDRFDVKLLCRNGTVTMYENFRECHWGLVPSQKILARAGEQDAILRENARLSFSRAQELFRPEGRANNILKLFGTYYGTDDVIFQSSSVGLQNELSEAEQAEENKIIKDFNYCSPPGGHPHGHGQVYARNDNEWSPKEQI